MVTKLASRRYLAFLRAMQIPYLVCGDAEIDFAQALVKLQQYFGIKKVALSGGALINGAFLKAGLVDEISLVMAPYISGDTSKKETFDTRQVFVNQRFKVVKTELLDDGGIHLLFAKDD